MNFLVDTNVVAEWVKPRPEPSVVAWFAQVDEDRVFLSVATFAEIRRGIDAMPAGQRRDRLGMWLAEELPTRFDGRVLDIDARVALRWGTVMARSQSNGVTMSTMDGFLAATAHVHELTLVTRNVKDFKAAEIALLDPWLQA